MEEEIMKLRCVDDKCLQHPETLSRGRVYEIDPRRDVEINPYGRVVHYLVNGKRYGSWRFRPDRGRLIDPAPQPLGCPPGVARAGESAEERAFRRFPIGKKG
jgi:hypothetical protein